MGILKHFATGKSKPSKGDSETIGTVTSSKSVDSRRSSSSKNSSGSSSSKNNNKAKNKVPTEVVSKQSSNVLGAKALVDSWNNWRGVDNMVAVFASEDSLMIPEEFLPMTARQLGETVHLIHESFPDIRWEYKRIVEEGGNRVGIEGLKCCGTHTGKPFSLMPGVLPEIAPAGVYVENAEELLWFKMVNGKIASVEIIAYGNMTGPAGLYEQIGGSFGMLYK